MVTRRCAISILLALLGCAVSGWTESKDEACQVTLTASKPKAACIVPAAFMARPPRLVELPVTKIENPSGQSFSVYLYVGANRAEPELIGNVTVFPADHTGVFLMRCQGAFERLGAARAQARFTIEIRRTLESRPWQGISVSIGPLRWLYDEPK
jgi:hypothetical protein